MRDKKTFFALILLTILSIYLGYELRPFYENIVSPKLMSSESMQSLDVQAESFQLWHQLKGFYNYNITNWKKPLTNEELKREGGVCWHYSDWYIEQAEKDGFMAKRVDFYGKDSGHSIAIIYDKEMTEYCIVSQTQFPQCSELGGDNEK